MVATAAGAIETIRDARKCKPDLAIVDYSMPDGNGLEVLVELRRWSPETAVVILTGREDTDLSGPLLDAGARGLLCKTGTPDDFCDALITVAAGKLVIDPIYEAQPSDTIPPQLTSREHQVLSRIALGLSNPAIARGLHLSPKTVETHRGNLMRKLSVNTTATLILRAARAGLIDL